jgi:hypothetical protein
MGANIFSLAYVELTTVFERIDTGHYIILRFQFQRPDRRENAAPTEDQAVRQNPGRQVREIHSNN